MKSIKALFVIALALGMAVPAFAETQNVKVSGSIDSYAFYRENYDLNDENGASVVSVDANPVAPRSEADSYFRTNAQVEVSADLTDNVSTVINVANQRDWNATGSVAGVEVPASVAGATEFDVDLDLAYVQMKEIFYSPLTLKIGRQDLWFGRGFIIGSNIRAWDANNSTSADEYSITTAFDAIRATLDFNPWTLDFVYSKITENAPNPEDDIDLYIANLNYRFAEYNAVAEGYYVAELDRSSHATANASDNDTHTVGVRAQFDPISPLTLGGELAYQFGQYGTATSERDRDAWAADLFATFRWDSAWRPELTVEYVMFSGESDLSGTSSSDYGAWNNLYRGHYYTAYADFREFLYKTSDPADQSATTNSQFIQLKGGLKPLEDLLVEGSLTYLWNVEDVCNRSDEIGWEVDLQGTYDYTEDVTFGVLAGWFIPGDFYESPNDDIATDVVGSVKVSF